MKNKKWFDNIKNLLEKYSGNVLNVFGGVALYSMFYHGSQMLKVPWQFSEYILLGGLTFITLVIFIDWTSPETGY